jgi:trk system potassium uptake protein
MMPRNANIARASGPAAWSWLIAALVGAAALVAEFGFRPPLLSADDLRMIYILGLLLFICSRVLLLIADPVVVAGRVERWWPDYVLIIAAAFWWLFNSPAEYVILRMGAIYAVLTGLGTFLVAGWRRMLSPEPRWAMRSPTLRLLGVGLICALIGGGVLSLPTCWAKPVTGEKATQYANHTLDCLFTATAALTGTGLTPHDLDHDFSQAGLVVILVLMQAGGLLVLLLAATTAWRFRRVSGLGTGREDTSAAGLARLAAFSIVVLLVLEAAGATAIYWQGNGGTLRASAGTLHWPSVLKAAFAAVGSFCNTGLTLSRDRSVGPLYAIILPLMIVGGIGIPPFYELLRRVLKRNPLPLSLDTRVTFIGTVAMIVVGAALLFTIESTRDYQLRYPRSVTPGRLQLNRGEAGDGSVDFSSEGGSRAQAERLRSMNPDARALQAGILAASATTGGGQNVRLDEPSVSPATRLVLIVWTLVGGGLGGTAGGMRLVLVYVLLRTLVGRSWGHRFLASAADTGDTIAPDSPAESASVSREGFAAPLRTHDACNSITSLAAAVSVGLGVLLLVGITALLLVYRETGSFESSLLEAASACCNAGLSGGLTPQLSPFGRSVLILAMLIGRLLPIGILLGWSLRADTAAAPEH